MNHSLASVFAIVLIIGCYEILASQNGIPACDFDSLKAYGIDSQFKNLYFGWKSIDENYDAFNELTYEVYSMNYGVDRKKLSKLEWAQVLVGGLEDDNNTLSLAPYIIPSNRTYKVQYIPGTIVKKEEKDCEGQYMYKTLISATYTLDVQDNQLEKELSGLLKLTCEDGEKINTARKVKFPGNWDMDVETPTIQRVIYDTEGGFVLAAITVKETYFTDKHMLFTRVVGPLVKCTSKGVRAIIKTYNKLLPSITPANLNITIEKEMQFQMDFVRRMEETTQGKRDLHFMYEKEDDGEEYSYKFIAFVCEQPKGTTTDAQVKCSKPDTEVITFTVPNPQDASSEE